MTVVDVSAETHTGTQIHTIECSLCGARRGEEFQRYSFHLHREHDPEDIGLGGDVV